MRRYWFVGLFFLFFLFPSVWGEVATVENGDKCEFTQISDQTYNNYLASFIDLVSGKNRFYMTTSTTGGSTTVYNSPLDGSDWGYHLSAYPNGYFMSAAADPVNDAAAYIYRDNTAGKDKLYLQSSTGAPTLTITEGEGNLQVRKVVYGHTSSSTTQLVSWQKSDYVLRKYQSGAWTTLHSFASSFRINQVVSFSNGIHFVLGSDSQGKGLVYRSTGYSWTNWSEVLSVNNPGGFGMQLTKDVDGFPIAMMGRNDNTLSFYRSSNEGVSFSHVFTTNYYAGDKGVANNTSGGFFSLDNGTFVWFKKGGNYSTVDFTANGWGIGKGTGKLLVSPVTTWKKIYSMYCNLSPSVYAGADQTINTGSASTALNGTGIDYDNDTITFQWTVVSGPTGSSFSNATLPNSNFVVTQNGTYVLRLTVSDNGKPPTTSTDEVTLTFSNVAPPPNQPPIVNAGADAQPSVKGPHSLMLNPTASDPEGGALSYLWEIVGNDVGIEFQNPVTIPNPIVQMTQSGVFTLKLTAMDALGASASDQVTFTYTNTNHDPDVGVLAPQTCEENQPCTLIVNATDEDGDPLHYAWDVAGLGPGAMNISGETTSTLTFTPEPVPEGQVSYQGAVFLTVMDDFGGLGGGALDYIIQEEGQALPQPNLPPSVSAGDDFTVSNKGPKYYQPLATATDPENDALSYSWTVSVNPNGGAILEILSQPQANVYVKESGDYVLRVTVTDAAGNAVQDSMMIRFTNINKHPTAVIPVKVYCVVNQPCIIPSQAEDGDGDPLTYAWHLETIVAKGNYSLNYASLDGSWYQNENGLTEDTVTLTPADTGTFSVSFTASDGFGGEETFPFDIIVVESEGDIPQEEIPLAQSEGETASSTGIETGEGALPLGIESSAPSENGSELNGEDTETNNETSALFPSMEEAEVPIGEILPVQELDMSLVYGGAGLLVLIGAGAYILHMKKELRNWYSAKSVERKAKK